MKHYLLFMTHSSTPLLQNQNPPGAEVREFDDRRDAQSVAEKEKNNWHRVLLFERKENDELEIIEQYLEKRKYHPDGRAWR